MKSREPCVWKGENVYKKSRLGEESGLPQIVRCEDWFFFNF